MLSLHIFFYRYVSLTGILIEQIDRVIDKKHPRAFFSLATVDRTDLSAVYIFFKIPRQK